MSAGGNIRFFGRIQQQMPTQLTININSTKHPPDATKTNGISPVINVKKKRKRKICNEKNLQNALVKWHRQSDMLQ